MKNTRKYIIIVLIILTIIILDQTIKAIIVNNEKEIIILQGILNDNKNGETSVGIKNSNIIGVIFTDILVISILLRFLIRQIENMNVIARISLSFIIAGGISNLIDRLIRGRVINYIDISQIINKFPIFNIANVFIIVGFVIFVIIVGIDLVKLKPRKLGGS